MKEEKHYRGEGKQNKHKKRRNYIKLCLSYRKQVTNYKRKKYTKLNIVKQKMTDKTSKQNNK